MKKINTIFLSILLLLTVTVNVSASDYDTPEISVFSHLYITPKSTVEIDYKNKIIYGLASNLSNLSDYLDITETGVTLNYSTSTIGTGTKIYVIKNGAVVETYEAVIFGDIDGDGMYNGTDAVIANCITNGMLTKAQVGKVQYMAADCNHDGEVNQADVDILIQAGLLLSEVSQTVK